MKTFEAEFGIGQKVLIVALEDEPAIVQSINFGTKGETYEVAWFHGGERKTAYLFANELRAAE